MAFRKVAAPTQDDALKEAEDHVALLHATDDGEKGGLTGIFCPREVDTVHDALGIAARWQGVTQDVDYERKLLVRALLQALPPGFVTLPEGCAALDDFDLAPVKVQPLLEALAARRRIDLATPEFRWDVKQPPPTFTWWGSKEEGQDHVPPPYGGLSRRQLEIAALEAVLLAFDETAAASEADQGLVQDRRLALRSLAANLGVGSVFAVHAVFARHAISAMADDVCAGHLIVIECAIEIGVNGRCHGHFLGVHFQEITESPE